MREMIVSGISIDPESKSPVLILRGKDGGRILPIWIGPAEAGAISAAITNTPLPRPLTHDLMATVLRSLNVPVTSVRIAAVRNGVFYAELEILAQGFPLAIDCRPSDAVALALRFGAPVYAEESVLQEAGREVNESSFLESGEILLQDNIFAELSSIFPDEAPGEKAPAPQSEGASATAPAPAVEQGRTVVLSREESEEFLGKLLRALEPESKYKM